MVTGAVCCCLSGLYLPSYSPVANSVGYFLPPYLALDKVDVKGCLDNQIAENHQPLLCLLILNIACGTAYAIYLKTHLFST